jgi:ABC-2 type transport system permease protein
VTFVALLARRSLARDLAGLAALLLGVFLFEAVQAPVVDAIGGSAGISALMDRLPPALRALARTRPEFLTASSLAGYLSLGFSHPLYLVLASSAVVGFAARALAGEMDRGTIQIALSRAVSRRQVFASRIVGTVLVALLVTVCGTLGLLAGYAYARPVGDFALANVPALGIATFALLWAVGGLALLGSAAASNAGRVVGWGLGVFVAMYFVDSFASIWTIVKPLEPLSLLTYFDPALALVTGALPVADLLVLGTVGLVATVAGSLVFARRDLPA